LLVLNLGDASRKFLEFQVGKMTLLFLLRRSLQEAAKRRVTVIPEFGERFFIERLQ
jgi:hypothetical protein